MRFDCVPFDRLSLEQLYEMLALRQKVFVVEQDCPYLDADGKDQEAYHMLMWENDQLIGYTRLLPAGISYHSYCSIGRVANTQEVRGKGTGQLLMKESIKECQKLFPGKAIKISAQVYLLKFYTDLGFIETEDRYLEDGIPHVAMTYKGA